MVIYGHCPGTGIAAAATGSIHALVGFGGMLAGGIIYAISYPWIKENILTVGSFGKIRLNEITPVPAPVWIALLIVATLLSHRLLKGRLPNQFQMVHRKHWKEAKNLTKNQLRGVFIDIEFITQSNIRPASRKIREVVDSAKT